MKRKFSVLILTAMIAAIGFTGCKKAPKAITPIEGSRAGIIPSTTASPPLTGNAGPGNGSGLNGTSLSQDPFLTGRAVPMSPIDGAGSGEVTPGERIGSGTENPEILQDQSVHFDFDKSTIRESEFPKLEAVAAYLKNNPNARLKIAGNCDERGTEEYNRSLGERRALAALDHLVKQQGIDPAVITTVSNGEDDPVDPSQSEEAYKKNRRDDFIVITP